MIVVYNKIGALADCSPDTSVQESERVCAGEMCKRHKTRSLKQSRLSKVDGYDKRVKKVESLYTLSCQWPERSGYDRY